MSQIRPLIACIAVALAAIPATTLASPLDDGGRTAVARPGSPQASKRALSASELRDELSQALASAGGQSGAWVSTPTPPRTSPCSPPTPRQSGCPRRIRSCSRRLPFSISSVPRGGSRRGPTRSGKLGGNGESVLDGDLVIVGDGDPAFGTARFARAADQPVTRVATLRPTSLAPASSGSPGASSPTPRSSTASAALGPDLSPLSGLSFNNGYDDGSYASDPELVAAKGLKKALRKRGVTVAGRVGRANLTDAELSREPLASRRLATGEGADRGDQRAIEQLLRRDAAQARRGRRLARPAHAGVALRWSRRSPSRSAAKCRPWTAPGSRVENNVSPAEVGELLVGMAEAGDNAAAFRGSLPIAGREGTVADRMRGTAAEGNCATKTGTLDGVSALSGYCDTGGQRSPSRSSITASTSTPRAMRRTGWRLR